ncbi:pirin family protein [Arenimonas sp.]|uniref:pirin family protein n=1 Tax=Arenimonas sp. TaxID=1872635 RepID=UPI0035B09BDF
MSQSIRPVLRTLRGQPASDGAGVKLTRVIGSPQLPDLDPFLMLDEFGTDRPEDYLAGFPEHPHRGFETVTYMLDGRMRHRDNHGNQGVLVPGSVQWMTAGRGIVHSEMPEQEEGRMRGFQLWVNLPARDKMTAPKYQEYGPDRFPEVDAAPGVRAKVIAGEVAGVRGPIEQPATQPTYLDLHLGAGDRYQHALPAGHTAFAYVYEGSARLGDGQAAATVQARELAVLGEGDVVQVEGREAGTRLILVAGQPLREPVARYGPFVMNTQAELRQAFEDYQAGRF